MELWEAPIGPARTAMASPMKIELIEVGVLATADGPLIIHAMPARASRFQPPKE